jgi:hypothetical protein
VGPPAPIPRGVPVPVINHPLNWTTGQALESENKKAMKTHLPGGAFTALFFLGMRTAPIVQAVEILFFSNKNFTAFRERNKQCGI